MTTITVTREDGATLQLTLSDHQNIYEWGDNIKTILTFLTFHPNTIDNILKDEDY
jgi:hypothetical protein